MSPLQTCAWYDRDGLLRVRSALGAWAVRLWPDPAVHAVVASEFHHAPPLYLELADAPVVRPHLAPLAVAGRTVPASTRRCAVAFAAPREQLFALQLLAAVPEAQPLLEAVPALGRPLLALMQHSRDWEALAAQIRAHRGRAQTAAVVRWLCGRVEPELAVGAMVKALQKARNPRAWTCDTVHALARWLVAEPKTVHHLTAITPVQVGAWHCAVRCSLAASLHIGFYRGIQHAGRALSLVDLSRVFEQIDRGSRHRPRLKRAIRSPQALAQRVFEAAEVLEQHEGVTAPVDDVDGWPSPMAVPDWIQPLRQPAALEAEGRTQRHCLGTARYRELVHTGRGYAYAVHHAAGRATAWVEPGNRAGLVTLTDLQAVDDVEPPAEVRVAVQQWVDAHNRWAMYRLHGGPMPLGDAVAVPDAAERFMARSSQALEPLLRVLVCAGLPTDRVGAHDPSDPPLPEPTAPSVDPWWVQTLEHQVEDSLAEVVRETVELRAELSRLVQHLRGLEAPGPDAQDAILLDFARCATLFERAFSAELADVARPRRVEEPE